MLTLFQNETEIGNQTFFFLDLSHSYFWKSWVPSSCMTIEKKKSLLLVCYLVKERKQTLTGTALKYQLQVIFFTFRNFWSYACPFVK